MKYQDGYFIQLPRDIFSNMQFLSLSDSAKWLYIILKELEHRYTGSSKEDFFFRSNQDLAEDCGWSLRKTIRVKKELEVSGLIQTWQMHWIDKETNKKSEKHVTAYRLT